MPLTARRLSLMCGSALSGASAVRRRRSAESLLDVVLDQRVELVGDVVAAQGQRLLAVDEDRRRRRLAGAGQADADVGMLALAGAVDDAAHHRDLHLLDAGVARLPHRHLRAQVVVDLLGQLLEGGAGGAAAARAGGDARVERAQAERLQDLERDHDLLGARLAGLRRQRDADRVADAFLQQHRQRRRSRRPCPWCPCRPRSGRDAAGSRSAAPARDRR